MSGKKILGIVLVSLALLQCSDAQYVANGPAEEYRIIGQFFNYYNSINRIKMDNMLKMSQGFVQQLLDTIPPEDRGNTAQLLQEVINNVQRERNSDSMEGKENALMQLQQLVVFIKTELVKQEPEDLVIRRSLVNMLELLARLSIEDRLCNEKFINAVKLLRQRFTPEGLQRHGRLFNVLSAISGEEDIVRREELTKQLKEIKEREYRG